MTYLLVGCGLKYIDAPNAPAALSWEKEGYTQRMNEIELSKCGYPIRNNATNDPATLIHTKNTKNTKLF